LIYTEKINTSSLFATNTTLWYTTRTLQLSQPFSKSIRSKALHCKPFMSSIVFSNKHSQEKYKNPLKGVGGASSHFKRTLQEL